jgi:hypothetical protein
MWKFRTCPDSKSNTQILASLWLLWVRPQKSMYLGTVLDIYLVKLSTRWMSHNPHSHSKNSTLQVLGSAQESVLGSVLGLAQESVLGLAQESVPGSAQESVLGLAQESVLESD